MNNITLFSQLFQHCQRELFQKAVWEFQTDKHNKGINSLTHFVSMLFLHFAKAISRREVTNGLAKMDKTALVFDIADRSRLVKTGKIGVVFEKVQK